MPTPPEIVVSYSELDTFRDCPLKHALAYKQRWVTDTADGTALSKGTLWHRVMEAHYLVLKASRQFPAAHQLKLAREAVLPLLHDQGAQTEDQALIEWMYDGYVQKYGNDPDWRIYAVEDKRVLPLPGNDGDDSRFSIKSKLDLIIQDRTTRQFWIVDHKSASDLTRKTELDLDDQFGLYLWGLNKLGHRVMGAIHSAARTKRLKTKVQTLDERFARTPMLRTDLELDNIAWDAYRAAHAAYSNENRVPYSSPNPRQCGWKCDFLRAHLLARKGIPIETTLESTGFYQLPEGYQRIDKESDDE